MSQLQQRAQVTDIQEKEIRLSINLLQVEGTSEKPRRILRSHKIRSTFYFEYTLLKLLCKLRDQVATGDKNNAVFKIDCSNCEAVYFRYKIREILIKNQKEKSRKIFPDIH